MIQIDVDLPKADDEMVELMVFGDGKVLQTGESWRHPDTGKCYYVATIPEKHFRATKVPPLKNYSRSDYEKQLALMQTNMMPESNTSNSLNALGGEET